MIAGFSIFEPRKVIVVLKGIAWNIGNLRSTYTSRLGVQTRRKVSEREVLRRMYPALTRKQPTEYASLRRVLNMFFEDGGRRKFQAAIQIRAS